MCERCGQLQREVSRRDEALAGMTVDLENLQADLLGKNRRIKTLENKLDKDAPNSASEKVRDVFEHWAEALGKNRKKVKLGAGREKALNARFNEGHTVEELKKAVDGMALLPYVGPRGRQATEKGGATRHDDLALVCRDETTVERFCGYVDLHQAAMERDREQRREAGRQELILQRGRDLDNPSRPRMHAGGLEAVLRALEERSCQVTTLSSDSTSARFMAQCPAHEDRSPSLSIRELGDGKVLLNCFAGCEAAAVVDELGLVFGDLFGFDQDRGASLDPAHSRWAS